ncbi:hypothetical protein QC762_113918 [Podospora pseudocomata]|uniref:Uncharacterized protein n=1 Tax=Podospora pseudocomata TaxID=2093779 RepID=A0ABR0GVI4_9PEZI|nr:hypothetical protein QC762_113918 [Podospora pseudocomata]
MHSPSRFQIIAARFSPHKLRTSFRRSSSASTSSRASSDRMSFTSQASSPVETINSIVLRQKSFDLDGDEKDLSVLEPRPAATFCSLEARMSSF